MNGIEMQETTVNHWPCFCDFWGRTCAHCQMRLSLNPTGGRITAVPVEVKPVVKRKRRSKRSGELTFTGERMLLIDPATNRPVGK